MIKLCVHCQAVNDFTQELDYCYKCGATNPLNSNFKTYDKVDPEAYHNKYAQNHPYSKRRGICKECKREMNISAGGRCGSCHEHYKRGDLEKHLEKYKR